MNSVYCPQCQKSVEWSLKFPHRPFCSERCRMIDLGAWADDSYTIPSNTPPDEGSPDSETDPES